MRFQVEKASDYDYQETVEINTIEDLIALSNRYNNEDLIINFRDNIIIIYDDYIE